MYLSNDDLDCIFRLYLTSGSCTIFARRNNVTGYLDGNAKQAQFSSPHKMCVDSDGNIYVADSGTHYIHKIKMETGFFSSVAGIPQTAGYLNGTNASAKFSVPSGIAIEKDYVLYVGDRDNHAIRRMAIE